MTKIILFKVPGSREAHVPWHEIPSPDPQRFEDSSRLDFDVGAGTHERERQRSLATVIFVKEALSAGTNW